MSPNEYYGSDEEYIFAGAEALRTEYKAITDAGLYVQIDDAHLPFTYDRMVPPASPKEFRKWARIRVDALNHALRDIPEDRVRYHICSGSNHGPHTHDVPLRDIIDLVLKVNARYLQIEQANAAHEHEWRIWEDVTLPDDKIVVPGVVTHHTMMVEHPELVAQRIIRLAGLIGRERVMAGTDCGFAQYAGRQRVSIWTLWAKLRSLVEGAALASDALWGTRPSARPELTGSTPRRR
jgi:5-methyltetrahydropteroyltriglutamate--homocysteine methyltransferase